ncbi:MAG: SDR family NAD(P)-dependent oxidoreductase [Acidimicrobiales bacterium]
MPDQPRPVRRVFVTGSMDGLGRGAAQALLDQGHEVVVHARSGQRAASAPELTRRSAGVVVGDLTRGSETRAVADQVNALGPFHAVIHNAGVYAERSRGSTPEGHATVVAVNVVAPYLLTALVDRPARLVYLTSGMHRSGTPSVDDLDWVRRRWDGTQAYCDSKLLVTALALAVAARWPEVRSHAVDPGWVPTGMGGPGAPDDLVAGHVTQAWLAVGEDDEARTTGGYWYHRQRQDPAPAAADLRFQQAVLAELERITGVALG